MPLESTQLIQVDDLLSRLAGEAICAKLNDMEGLVPAYSLLSDMRAVAVGDERLQAEIDGVMARLDGLLEKALPFDQESLEALRHFVNRLSGMLKGGEVTVSATEVMALEPPVTVGVVDGAEESPAEELLALDLAESGELLREFHTEALDHLQQIEAALLVLDGTPDDRDALNGLFRSFHTIKGVAGFLHLGPMHRLAHEVESLLDLARNSKLRLRPEIVTEILRSRDAIQAMVHQITLALEQGKMPEQIIPVRHLMQQVRHYAQGGASSLDEQPVVPMTPVPVEGPASGPAAPVGATAEGRRPTASTVRVNTEKLDSLLNVVGELVIVQSQLQESARGLGGQLIPLTRNLAQLGRITKELQHTSMSLRMVPIKPTFQRMERLVRDLCRDFGKRVQFTTVGEDTEIDRTVVEEVVDPLVHMVRNSMDHGLEDPADRQARGKPPEGRLRLAAFHEGSSLVIELSDDGRGINRDKVLARARRQGLVAENVTPPVEEILGLIFLPGFSTAEKVTAVSGRGVGMDVVRRNIERLRGQVMIQSEEGQGTTFRIKLPLTTAIIDGLLVRVGEERFIVPTTMVQVALRPSCQMLTTVQGQGEVLEHRGRLLALERLHRRFAIAGAVEEATHGIVVIVESAGRVYGLLVDELLSKQEVVIKNLGAYLHGMQGVAGGAILGDGTIALILDPAGLCAA
jgi:two-component system, chemotaxis family, sensor kinase CheA